MEGFVPEREMNWRKAWLKGTRGSAMRVLTARERMASKVSRTAGLSGSKARDESVRKKRTMRRSMALSCEAIEMRRLISLRARVLRASRMR